MSKSSVILLSALTALALFVMVLSSPAQAANHQLKRQVAPKQLYESLPEHCDQNVIVVKLREGTNRPLLDGVRFNASGKNWDRLNDILSARNATASVRPRLSLDPAKLDKMRAEGSRRVGQQLPDLTLYYEIQLADDLSSEARVNMINKLNGHAMVELAYFALLSDVCSGPPDGKGPGGDSEPTPSFEYGQYYLQPAPVGFDAYYAWSFPGGHGENVKVIDIESNWNETHEDLHGGTDSFLIAGMEDTSFWSSPWHGTAVLGLIGADSNEFGMTGIAYETELGAVSMMYMPLADAIAAASANSETGGIILIEVANLHPGGDYVACEVEQACFDVILTASALGQIVVEVAGNSNQDFDDIEIYDSLFYPDYRFSGAILVAMSTPHHVPDLRTCYGQRIDVHGFGVRDIYTLGGGTLWGTEENNYYSQGFSGTSAASASMSGVCAAVQGVYKQQTGLTLDHAGMRALLRTYSVPQADHYKRIGPSPDLAGICDAITGFIRPEPPALVSPDDGFDFTAPAQPTFDWDDVSGALSYEVIVDDNYNFTSPVGQETGLTNSEWTSSMLQQGKYFWRVRAVNEYGFGAWSNVRSILVDVDIQAPILMSPEDGGSSNTRVNIPLLWYPVEGVLDYLVEVDSLPDFSSKVRATYSLPCTGDTCSYGISILLSGETYYWRVSLLGENTPLSDVWSFQPKGSIGALVPPYTAEPAGLPDKLVLRANYPNPFNPETQISFSLPEPAHTRLEIFNILGQKVSTLVNRHMSAGEHTVAWNARDNSSGVYLYKLSAGESIVSKKMLLLK